MKKYIVGGGILLILGGAFVLYRQFSPINSDTMGRRVIPRPSGSFDTDLPAESIIAQDLDTPWGLVFLPDRSLLLTERPGRVVRISPAGVKMTVATLYQVQEIGEGGLLGIDIHPDFSSNNLVYLYYTYRNDGNNTLNRVVQMRYESDSLSDEKIIVDQIPGASNHNGGRIKFGPDKRLYITTGDAQEPSQAQERDSLAGKILRVNDDGTAATGNPFNTKVYSYGHRNPQGLTWDEQGRLWATEHGRSGIQSGLDELNLIEPGKNYGWPDIEGDRERDGMETPRAHSGGSVTWAPGGATYLNGSIFFTGLRGRSLYEARVEGDTVTVTDHLQGTYGRIRDVIVGPDGMLYIATSNEDGRGIPAASDDRIIRIHSSSL